MKKTEFIEATKTLSMNDQVRARVNGYPFPDFEREGQLIQLTEEDFTLHTKYYPGIFTHSYRRLISIIKI